MRFIKSLAIILLSLPCVSAHAEKYNRDLISDCASIQLKSCKMTNRTVKFDQASKYKKAFICIKNGSSTGDTFDIGIPIPDLGELGLGTESTATYSTETCKEEIAKLDSASFLKSFSETFDQECGHTLAGQYQQCTEAASRLSEPQSIQSLKCSAAQSANKIIINTKYIPGSGEGPKQYRINSISGVENISCEKNSYAGVNQYSSLSCSLPNNYQTSQLVIKLGNGVTCSVQVDAERKLELQRAKKLTCSGAYNSLPGFKEMPLLIKSTMAGLCDICLTENIKTTDSDQRTLANRLTGCAVWAAKDILEHGNSKFCSVKASENSSPYANILSLQPLTSNGLATSEVLSTAIGTEREVVMSFGSDSDNIKLASSLCNDRKEGEIIQLQGHHWKDVPIDYLSAGDSQSIKTQEFIHQLELFFKQN